MEITLMLLRQILAMIAMALCGVALTKAGLLDKRSSKGLGIMALYLAAPCSMIHALQTPFNTDKLGNLAVTFVAAVLIQILTFAAVWLFCRGRFSLTPGERASVLFNNANNLIIPLIIGSLGSEYVLYSSTYVCTLTLLMWSYGIILMGGREAFSVKRMLRTPATLGVFVGMFLFLMNITLPAPVASAVASMGNCIGPLSMVVVGGLLAEVDFKKTFSMLSLYRVIFLRLLALPALALVFLWGVEFLWDHPDARNILTVTLLCAVGPSSSTITQMAQLYENPESGYISSINAATVVISMVTIPVMVFIFRLL